MSRILVLTDHKNHSSENSLYTYIQTMVKLYPMFEIYISTRYTIENNAFFHGRNASTLYAVKATSSFQFSASGSYFFDNIECINPKSFDLIWLRLPPPLSADFLDFMNDAFPNTVIINHPKGIYDTGSKAFLMNFESIIPSSKICNNWNDIESFAKKHEIVLKPFREYGGKGIIRIKKEVVWDGQEQKTLKSFKQQYLKNPIEYLGVKFLKNVHQGDKRIVVVNGKIMGASLRLPAKDNWLCNVSMGGTSNQAEVTPEEIKIVETVNPTLSKMGIVMYGLDTLVGDDGLRVLSEINTTSIGGLPQIAKLKNLPLVEEALELILDYYNKKKATLNVE